MAETTQSITTKYDNLDFYETLEIQLRTADATYTGSWVDVSDYLLESSPVIERKLDFDGFGFGEFFFGTLELNIDNSSGYFNDIDYLYSVFFGSYSRNLSRVRYKAGYYDRDGNKIDETAFEGLLIDDEFYTSLETGEASVIATDYAAYMKSVIIPDGTFSGSDTYKNIVADLVDLGNIQTYITYSAGNINPDFNLTFDDTSVFNGSSVFDVLTDITQKSNSVFYLDSSNNLIVADRSINAGTAFEFIGGYYGSKDTNIIGRPERARDRYNMVNSAIIENDSINVIYSDSQSNLNLYGLHQIDLSTDSITNSTTASSVCQIIVNDGKLPKERYSVPTVYLPNVLDFKDPCTISWNAFVEPSSNPLIWNGNTYINSGYLWNTKPLATQIENNVNFKYYGYQHRIRDCITNHYLVEE